MMNRESVIPAKAGIQSKKIPAFAGMTILTFLLSACGGLEPPVVDNSLKMNAQGQLQVPDNCPNWSADPTSNHYNVPLSNHGCAYYGAIGKQIAEPQDWVQGRGTASQHGDRNSIVMERYRTMQPLGGAEQQQMLQPQVNE
jgi:hypothetical protein